MSSFTLAFLADFISAKPVGNAGLEITGIANLANAEKNHISFIASDAYLEYLKRTEAGIVILSEKYLPYFSGNALVVDDPYLAYSKLTSLFCNTSKTTRGVHVSAVVAECAIISESVSIGANAVIASGVNLAEGVVVGAGCCIGENCVVGENTRLSDNVTLYAGVQIGINCLLHSGSVIGADGFGFSPDKTLGGWSKIHQLGTVHVGDRVEIGACTTIDCGALEDTVIASGVIIDNQVQVGHNCYIGENTAIAAQAAIAGSTIIGKNCTIAGAVGIAGHLELADNVHISGMSMVTKSIMESGSYSSGTRVTSTKEWRKNTVRFNQLNTLVLRVKALEEQLKKH